MAAERSAQLLARCNTRATFKGIDARKCMFMTSACPDHCNHGKKWAVFNITEYVEYEKPGQYGDEKEPTFAVQLEPWQGELEHGRVDHVAGTQETIAALSPGDAVELEWLHEYITEGGAKYPIRRVTKLNRV